MISWLTDWLYCIFCVLILSVEYRETYVNVEYVWFWAQITDFNVRLVYCLDWLLRVYCVLWCVYVFAFASAIHNAYLYAVSTILFLVFIYLERNRTDKIKKFNAAVEPFFSSCILFDFLILITWIFCWSSQFRYFEASIERWMPSLITIFIQRPLNFENIAHIYPISIIQLSLFFKLYWIGTFLEFS